MRTICTHCILEAHGNFRLGHVKMTVAHHGSGLPDGSYGGNPGGYRIDDGEKSLYITGDTGLFSDMALYPADIVVLPIGDNFTMGPTECAACYRICGCQTRNSGALQHVAIDRTRCFGMG